MYIATIEIFLVKPKKSFDFLQLFGMIALKEGDTTD